MMLSHERQRQDRSALQAPKITGMLKHSIRGTLSPETSIATSSGYSTGGSSVSTTRNTSSKKASASIDCKQQQQQQEQQQQQQNTKPKGLHNLLSKLKNLLIPSKPKHLQTRTMRSAHSRQISSTNILRQYHQHPAIYDALPSTLTTSNTISLPFTYCQDSPIQQSRATFEKISAWLDHTAKMTQTELDSNDLSFVQGSQRQSTSLSSAEIDSKVIPVVMKQTPPNIKPPKRSSSLVARITRPIIEQQQQQQQTQKSISPSSSFSSSILTKGMTERMTPSPTTPPTTNYHSSRSHRRRTIDFARRRSIVDADEPKSNKENLSVKYRNRSPQDIYQFAPSLSTNAAEVQLPPTKHVVTKKYYFHSSPTKTPNEDLLNSSYGLTLLSQQQQQQQQQQPRPRHSVAAVLMISQVPNHVLPQPLFDRRPSIPQHTTDSLDDLLCDREVESYFYPMSPSPSEHIYMNFDNPSHAYQHSLSCLHGTLC